MRRREKERSKRGAQPKRKERCSDKEEGAEYRESARERGIGQQAGGKASRKRVLARR